MNNLKLLNRISWTSIGLAFIFLIGLTIYQHQQIKKLAGSSSEEISHNTERAGDPASSLKNTEPKTARLRKSETVSSDKESEVLSYQLQATEEELQIAHDDLNKEMDRKDELAQQRRELQKQQMQSPYLIKYMREHFASQYADFFEAFNISPENAEAFLDILMAEYTASQELYFEAQEITNPTEADRIRFKQLNDDLNATYEAQKTNLIGEEAFEEYPPYQQRWYLEEYEVGSLSEAFDSSEKLTETQQAALVDALLEAQTSLKKEREAENNDESDAYTFPSEQYSQENIDRTVENMTRIYEAYVEAARTVLTPSQTEKYKAYLDQQLDNLITNMKITGMEYYSYDYGEQDSTGTVQ